MSENRGLMTFPMRDVFPGLSVTFRTSLTGQQSPVFRFQCRMKAVDCGQLTPSLRPPMAAHSEKRTQRVGSSTGRNCSRRGGLPGIAIIDTYNVTCDN